MSLADKINKTFQIYWIKAEAQDDITKVVAEAVEELKEELPLFEDVKEPLEIHNIIDEIFGNLKQKKDKGYKTKGYEKAKEGLGKLRGLR